MPTNVCSVFSISNFRVVHDPWILGQLEGLHRLALICGGRQDSIESKEELTKAIVTYYLLRSPDWAKTVVIRVPVSAMTLCDELCASFVRSKLVFIAGTPEEDIPAILKQASHLVKSYLFYTRELPGVALVNILKG